MTTPSEHSAIYADFNALGNISAMRINYGLIAALTEQQKKGRAVIIMVSDLSSFGFEHSWLSEMAPELVTHEDRRRLSQAGQKLEIVVAATRPDREFPLLKARHFISIFDETGQYRNDEAYYSHAINSLRPRPASITPM